MVAATDAVIAIVFEFYLKSATILIIYATEKIAKDAESEHILS